MKNIKELYHFENKWYDYPVALEAKHEWYKTNSPKPFKVYHFDGTFDLAYTYGEHQFTFDVVELKLRREQYQADRKASGERNALIKQLQQLDTETLKMLVDLVK